MADPEHTSLAKQGAHAIARWREKVYWRRQSIDLSGAYLSESKLRGADLAHDNLANIDLTNSDLQLADLSGSNLQGAHLWRSNLSGADFRRAILKGASLVRCNLQNSSLQGADLSGADLSNANLWCANLAEATLQGANLTGTNLSWVDLAGADLRNCRLTASNLEVANLAGADLRGAMLVRPRLSGASLEDCLFEMTLLADCDLSQVRGLESTRHSGPSFVGAESLAKSKGLIPESFLLQAGVAAPFIEAQREFGRSGTKSPRVLLISSTADKELATRIEEDLRQSGVLCWSLTADDEETLRLDQGSLERIIYYDLLLLVCSQQALGNPITSRLFAQLEPGAGSGAGSPGASSEVVTLAADDWVYTSQDQVCTKLRGTVVVDLRGSENEGNYRQGLIMLEKAITGS